MKHKRNILKECERFLSEKKVVTEVGLMKIGATLAAAIWIKNMIDGVRQKNDVCISACDRMQNSFKPRQKKICLAKCRIEVYRRAVAMTQEAMHQCHKAKHPDLCKYKFQKFLNHYKDKLFSQQLLLRKLVEDK